MGVNDFEVGDLVRIKPFSEGICNGVRLVYGMMKYIGQERMITSAIGTDVFRLDTSDSFVWPPDVFEKLDSKAVVYGFNGQTFVELWRNDDNMSWEDSSGWSFYGSQVGLIEDATVMLPYNIHKVGSKGDVVKAIRFRGKLYLSPDYLPMCGEIENKEEEEWTEVEAPF